MVRPYEAPMPYGGVRIYGGAKTIGSLRGDRRFWMLKGKNYKVARLVCEAFHGSPLRHRPYCIHKDENAQNNTPSNLKWSTQKENLNAPGFLAYCRSRTGENSPVVKWRRRREDNGRTCA